MSDIGAQSPSNEHIDRLAKRYLGADRYPFHRAGQQRIILKIQPQTIHTIGLED